MGTFFKLYCIPYGVIGSPTNKVEECSAFKFMHHYLHRKKVGTYKERGPNNIYCPEHLFVTITTSSAMSMFLHVEDMGLCPQRMAQSRGSK